MFPAGNPGRHHRCQLRWTSWRNHLLHLFGMHLPLDPWGSSLATLEGEALLHSSGFEGELVSENPANFWWFLFVRDINPNILALRGFKELILTSPE